MLAVCALVNNASISLRESSVCCLVCVLRECVQSKQCTSRFADGDDFVFLVLISHADFTHRALACVAEHFQQLRVLAAAAWGLFDRHDLFFQHVLIQRRCEIAMLCTVLHRKSQQKFHQNTQKHADKANLAHVSITRHTQVLRSGDITHRTDLQIVAHHSGKFSANCKSNATATTAVHMMYTFTNLFCCRCAVKLEVRS